MPERLDHFLGTTRIAYFSMELAIGPEVKTYAGGLGILAGDSARSAADLGLPMVFVTLISRAGYFRQVLDADGRQTETPDHWDPARFCQPLAAMLAIEIAGRPVWIRPWLHLLQSPLGGQVPVILLDTDLDVNAPEDRRLTDHLYGGDDVYRLRQEIVLGIGGARILRALGFEIDRYHLNEGHAALLTLELLRRAGTVAGSAHPAARPEAAEGAVRARCVFTTHTPVEAGHDQFSWELFEHLMPDYVPAAELRRLAGPDRLNVTRLALNLSGYVNGVARRHAETTQRMFPGYTVHAITNGVHPATWVHPALAGLLDRAAPRWRHEPEHLVRALDLADADLAAARAVARSELFRTVAEMTGRRLDPGRPTIGYARRMTGYKRPLMLFSDIDRLRRIARTWPFQIVMAGKAHPRDGDGKDAIRRLHALARDLEGEIDLVFLPDYEMGLARQLVSGTDIWLNTPLPPFEASGTSGMKAALNGVLNLSVLDGWWIEAWVEGATGWAINTDGDGPDSHAAEALDKLENVVLPLFHDDPAGWARMMKRSIAHVGSTFSSQRMMRRYASEAYLGTQPATSERH